MSNIRQRRGPSPSRDGYGQSSTTSWEIATEDIGDNDRSHARKSKTTTIPMYNPVTMQMQSSVSSNLGDSSSSVQLNNPASSISHRVSWTTIMEAKKGSSNNREFLLRDNDSLANYHDSTGGYYAGGDSHSLRSGRSLRPMSPALIPDSAYRAYLSGQPVNAAKRKKSGGSIDLIQIAKIIGYFSLVGFLFLTFIGVLIDTQPMFMQGVLTKNEEYQSGKKTKTFYAVGIKERLEPAKHAYRGGLLYLLTAVVCLGYAHNMHHILFKKGWQQYRDVGDVDSTVPTFHHHGGDDGLHLPTNGAAIHRQAYTDHNGLIARTWQSTCFKFQRLEIYLTSVWQARRGNRRRFAGAKDV